MPIGGGIKFFAENPALVDSSGSIVSVTSGSVVASNMIDKLSNTYWTSVGSSDSITETIVVGFGSTSISRLLLLDHNFKDFVVKYWNGSAWTHFAAVVGLDGSKSNITETAFADDTAYYEFTPVTTNQIQIVVNKTQVVDAQKYIATVFPTTELGTLSGFPGVSPSLSPKSRSIEMLSGNVKIIKQRQVPSITLDFKSYPVLNYSADVDLILSLIDREVPFYIWLCGGRRGSSYFSYAMRMWRLRDCYRVQIESDIGAEWTSNLYKSGQNLGSLLFRGHV